MSEALTPHEPPLDNNVVPFERKQSGLRSLYANDMTTQEIAIALDTLDQHEMRSVEGDRRPTYILNRVLLALNVTPEMNSLYRPDQTIDPHRKADALHGLSVDKTIKRVRGELDELGATLSREDMSDYRESMTNEVTEKMASTNVYRAFNHLTDNVAISREVRMNGLVQANRLCYALLYDYILKQES